MIVRGRRNLRRTLPLLTAALLALVAATGCAGAALEGDSEPEPGGVTDNYEPGDAPVAWAMGRSAFTAADGLITIHFTDPGTAPGEGTDSQVDDALADAIHAAESSVDLCLYEFNRVEIIDAALAAVERGVTVRFVGDGDEAEDEGYVALLDAGVVLSLRAPRDRIMHNKFGVIDGRHVFTGSTNVSDNGMDRNNNNYVAVDSEALAAVYTAEFEQMFVEGRFGRKKAASGADAPIVVGDTELDAFFCPADGPVDRVRNLLATADHSVYFLIFSFTQKDIAGDLLALHDSGLQVFGIFDESQARGRYSVDESMAEAGVPVFIDGNRNASGFSGGKLHHKVMLIDAGTDSDPLVITGSYNWSNAGSEYNDENVLVLRGAELVQPYLEEFCARLDEADMHPSLAEAPADPCAALIKAVRVNEILPNPDGTDTYEEYVEIVNAGVAMVDLAGWTLGDATRADRHVFDGLVLAPGGAVTVYSGANPEEPQRVVASSGRLSLANNADEVQLRDAAGVLVDRVAYRSAPSGVSFNRNPDGAATGAFELHTVHGPEQSPNLRADLVPWARPRWDGIVVINELLPNPDGTDLGQEYVEIVNTGTITAYLDGWTLSDNASVRHVFSPGSELAPGAALVLFDRGDHSDVPGAAVSSTGMLSLNNGTEKVTLADTFGEAVDTFRWDSSTSGKSLNRAQDGDANSEIVAHDAVEGAHGAQSPGLQASGLPWLASGELPTLVINEVFPNPEGTDSGGEFVELVNAGSVAADLSRFALGDATSPKRHEFADGTVLQPGAALVVFDRGDHSDIPGVVLSSTGSLSLNNTGDTVLLRSAQGVVLDTFAYTAAPMAISLNRAEDGLVDGAIVPHDTLPAATMSFSPGTRADGTAF